MTTLIEQMLSKLGLIYEPNVLEKTTELLRLLDLRSSNVPLQINEYGKIVLCADIASNLLAIEFDYDLALKLSALRKTQYANNKQMFKKLLDLNKLANINDICVQLSLSEVSHKAEELLTLFKTVTSENTDTDHPQYAAMAVLHSCRLLKKKVSKTKLMSFSNLRPTQWQQLEQQWERMISKHHRKPALVSNLNEKIAVNQEKDLTTQTCSQKCTIEKYEEWRSRILAQAEAKLNDE